MFFWDVDVDYGVFVNDISFFEVEIVMIQVWVDQGVVEGDVEKMFELLQMVEVGSWKMGEELDYVIEFVLVDVLEGGFDFFIMQVYVMDVFEGKWVCVVELLFGNIEILYYVVIYFGFFGMVDDEEEGNVGVNKIVYLNDGVKWQICFGEVFCFGGVWVVGSLFFKFLFGSGKMVELKQMFFFNMYYYLSGNVGIDVL